MQKLWFKRKTYGWGWTPVTWQGWLVVLIYVGCMVGTATLLDGGIEKDSNFLIRFIVPFVFFTSILISICYKKGEKPKWTWGGK